MIALPAHEEPPNFRAPLLLDNHRNVELCQRRLPHPSRHRYIRYLHHRERMQARLHHLRLLVFPHLPEPSGRERAGHLLQLDCVLQHQRRSTAAEGWDAVVLPSHAS